MSLAVLRHYLSALAIAAAVAAGCVAAAAPYALIAALGYTLLIAPPQEAPPPPRTTPAPAPDVTFIDRFTGIDTERWRIADGWDNGAWVENDLRREALRITPEGLTISLAPNPPGAGKPYSSGELQSQETYRYGYFEARMRLPRGEGLVVGLFTFVRPEGNSTWEEIDIEFLGRRTDVMEATYHVHGRSVKETIALGFDASEDFHSYGFEWTADAIRWYVDGRMVHEARDERVARMTRAQRLYLNLWNSAGLHEWVGRIDPREAPWVLTISCVAHARAYHGAPLCAE
jgi:beta-glucanase (GH16 family)